MVITSFAVLDLTKKCELSSAVLDDSRIIKKKAEYASSWIYLDLNDTLATTQVNLCVITLDSR